MLIGLIIIFFVAIYLTMRNKDVLHPLLVYIAPFLVQYIVYVLMYKEEQQVSEETLKLYGISIVIFSCCYVFSEIFFNKIVEKDRKMYIPMKNFTFPIFNIVAIVGMIAILFEILKVAENTGFSEIYSSMRYLINYGDGYNFIAKYFPVLYKVLYACFLYNNSEQLFKVKKSFMIYTTIFFLFSILSFTRTDIMMAFFIVLYCLVYKRQKDFFGKFIRIIKLLLKMFCALLVLIFLFIFIASITNKLGDSTFFSKEFFLWKYLAYPIVTIDEYIIDNPRESEGYFVLGVIGKILENIGVYHKEFEYLLPRRGVFNVFTYIGTVYFDLGNWGYLFQGMLGCFIAFLYVNNLKKGAKWTVFYSFYIYSIFMSFYAYQYSLTTYVYIILCFILINVFNRIFIKK